MKEVNDMLPWTQKGAIKTYLMRSRNDIPAADLGYDILMDGHEDPLEEVEERATQCKFAKKLPERDSRLWTEIFNTDFTIQEIARANGMTKKAMVKKMTALIKLYLKFRDG